MMKKFFAVLLVVLTLSGCASIWDAPRNIIGWSTREMEDARKGSLYQVYQAEYFEMFDAVLAALKNRGYSVFTEDPIRGLVVVMGIPDVVDTTEVGVFLTELPLYKGVKVEVSSRSTPAQRTVSQSLFLDLGEAFTKL